MLVPPDAARRKLERLAALGVGHRRAAHLAGIAVSTVQGIRAADRAHITSDVEAAILGITRPSLARGQRVNGYRTRYLLACLLREGLSRRWIAMRMGLRSRQVRIRPHKGAVTVTTALKVQALYAAVNAEGLNP